MRLILIVGHVICWQAFNAIQDVHIRKGSRTCPKMVTNENFNNKDGNYCDEKIERKEGKCKK